MSRARAALFASVCVWGLPHAASAADWPELSRIRETPPVFDPALS